MNRSQAINFCIKISTYLRKTNLIKVLMFVTMMLANLQNLFAQNYAASIDSFRNHYKQEFLEDPRSPLKQEDFAYLRFYDADKKYKVLAQFIPATGTDTIVLHTKNKKEKKYIVFGKLKFKLRGKIHQLFVYRQVSLLSVEQYKDHVFLPFTDKTTSIETYGGGRYIDLKLADFASNKVELDFNKCYNPYCAFGDGFSCPIPPQENYLNISIRAGEKLFAKNNSH
jgi:uncharacterized protein